MNLAGYAIRHNAVTLLAVVLLTLGGGVAYLRLGCLEDPEFTIKEAVIYTQYPGATASEVELEVTDPENLPRYIAEAHEYMSRLLAA
ncbi:MAG: efflux RND transporter permease subunit [Thermogutta sp.]|nr:efflux RND transporter permease subunit [Thermogutta sp.]